MLGERQGAAAAELAQWWHGVRQGGVGSHAVLLTAPVGWGRSTVLEQLPAIIGQAGQPASLQIRLDGTALPSESGAQAEAIRDCLLGTEMRQQAAALLCRSRLRGIPRLSTGTSSLLLSGVAGAISLVLAGLAAAAAGGSADGRPASENGSAARAARVVAAVSASVPVLVIIDDADYLDPGIAVTLIENLIDHYESRVLVVASVDLDSDLAAALAARARFGPTEGRVHRAETDPRMGQQSRAELAGQLSPHLTALEAQQLARQTRTFAEIFAAARSGRLS